MIAYLVLLVTNPPAAPPAIAVAPPQPVARVAFNVGEKRYGMPIPKGYCIPRSKPAAVSHDEANSAGYILTKPVYFWLCKTRAGEASDQNFVYMRYLKNYDPKVIDRASFIAAVAGKMKSPEYLAQRESKDFVEAVERRTKADTGREITASISGVALGHDESCVYTGTRFAIGSGNEQVSADAVTCTTLINGKVAMLDVTSRIDRGLGFGELALMVKRIVDSIEPS